MSDTRSIVQTLLTERPMFHGREAAGSADYSIMGNILNWIAEHAPENGASLETGCGYSTIVLAMKSKSHTVISPFPQEHKLIQQWCAEKGIDLSHVNFIPQISQDVIYKLGDSPLDLVLIDGDHAFPAPFIDWYYTADRVKKGGFVLVDDTQLITGKILKDFLIAEKSRWDLFTDMGKTAIFKRNTDEPVANGIPWIHQPYCMDYKPEAKKKPAPKAPQNPIRSLAGKVYRKLFS